MMDIILPLKPKFVNAIFEWKKIYELRRIFPKNWVNKVFIYATSPISLVVWEFEVEQIFCDKINNLWNLTKGLSFVNKEYFYDYYKWNEYWYAIKLNNPVKYSTYKSLYDFWLKKPPQNYYFLKK